jgi:hypothetical protein
MRTSAARTAPRPARLPSALLVPALVVFAVLHLAGCGVPGDPVPLRVAVPAAVMDLAVRQAGDGAMLAFTPPRKTIEGERLSNYPDIEIFRGYLPAGSKKRPSASALQLVYTIPGAAVDTYLSQDRVEVPDPLEPEDLAAHAGQRLFYVVRTRVSAKQASADSNVVSVMLYPTPARIGELHASVIEAGVQISWTAPERTSAGQPLTSLTGYRIYRAEVEPGADGPAKARRKGAAALVGVSPSANYLDAQMEWGHSYVYTVRSVAQYAADSVESADSPPVLVTPLDTFPPARPRDLVAVAQAASATAPATIELSWAISPEADLAGYYVYRSEAGAGPPQRLNRELLLTPTFRDISVAVGSQYTYTVTAVDRAGNESPPGAAVTAVVPRNGS